MANTVLINPFEIPEGQPDEVFLAGWQRAADYMRRQPGFVGTHASVMPAQAFGTDIGTPARVWVSWPAVVSRAAS